MLTDEQRRLYARQVLLHELGIAGQARLCASRVAVREGGDALATRVTRDYVQRAGLLLDDEASVELTLPMPGDVQTLAGDPALRDCAAWLAGAFAAVETIKRCVEVGRRAQLDPELRLNAEVV